MTSRTKYQIGSGLLAIGVVIVVVNLLGMTGITRKLASSRELSLVAMVIVVVGGGVRRRARREMDAPAAPSTRP